MFCGQFHCSSFAASRQGLLKLFLRSPWAKFAAIGGLPNATHYPKISYAQ
jgi:hypothetical protein